VPVLPLHLDSMLYDDKQMSQLWQLVGMRFVVFQ
jgi:hypothetical protein